MKMEVRRKNKSRGVGIPNLVAIAPSTNSDSILRRNAGVSMAMAMGSIMAHTSDTAHGIMSQGMRMSMMGHAVIHATRHCRRDIDMH